MTPKFIFKKRALNILLSTLIALILILIFSVKYYANKFCYKNINNIPKTPIGLILGAGIKNQSPSVYLKDRLDKGLELYKLNKVDKLLISGDNGNDKDDEITVMKNYLLENGLPADKILIDTGGYDTYSSMYRAKNIFHLDTLTVITQNYHLDRAVFIARKLGLHCYGFIADKSKYAKYSYYSIREYFSILKACWDIIRNRKIAV